MLAARKTLAGETGLGSGVQGQGRLGVELPGALAAGHHIAVPAILDYPPIHHHQGPPFRRPQQGDGKAEKSSTNPISERLLIEVTVTRYPSGCRASDLVYLTQLQQLAQAGPAEPAPGL